MSPSKLSKSVLQQIEQKHIEPTAKWHFLLKNVLWWMFFSLSILLGGAGGAVVLFAITHHRFDYVDLFAHAGPAVWIGMMPIFWVVFFVGFVWASFWGLAHTKKTYRIPRFLLIFVNVVLTLLWATVVYSSESTERFERAVVRHVPFMQTVREQRMHRWERVEDGFLVGKIQSVKDNVLVVKTRGRGEFAVDISEAVQKESGDVQSGDMVRFTGELVSTDVFKAESYGVFDPKEIRDRMKKHRMQRGGQRPPQGMEGQRQKQFEGKFQ